MELLKTEYTFSKGIGKLDKVLINCEDTSYSNLINFLKISSPDISIILKILHNHKKEIVLKFGKLELINNEYEISKELLNLPNFIIYYCKFECNDTIKNIINYNETIMNYKINHYGDNPVGIIVMKNYKLGCIYDYDWTIDNFDILKNLIKQVVFAIILAYETKGFIHGDLHCGNVLIKPKNNLEIIYSEKVLIVNTFECLIMDFERSVLNQNNIMFLIRNITKFIDSIISSNKMNLFLNYDRNKIFSLRSSSKIDYNFIETIIDDFEIIN